jgi:hypothetical protein
MRHRCSRRPSMSVPPSAFAGFRFPPDVILLAVRWYLRFGLSYRDVEELLAERGIQVDHVTVYRWVQRFSPLLTEAARPTRHAVGCRWHVDETYLKVGGTWRYLYPGDRPGWPVIDVRLTPRRYGRPRAVHGQVVGVSDPAAGLVLNAKSVSTIETVTQSCRSVIEAAIGSSSPDPLMAAWSCVKQLDEFRVLVMDLLVGVAAKRGLTLTGAIGLHLAAIMGGQAFNRVIAETWLFGLPNPYRFSSGSCALPGGCARTPPPRPARPPAHRPALRARPVSRG